MEDPKKYYSGEWHLHNLNFVVEYIKAAGMSVPEFAKAAGIMPYTLRYWLNEDDTLISKIEKCFDNIGIKLKFKIYSDSDEMKRVRINMSSVVNAKKEQRRLDFFSQAIDKYAYSKKELAEKIGLTYPTVWHWFTPECDDCYISYIFRFCETYNLRLDIDLLPKDID